MNEATLAYLKTLSAEAQTPTLDYRDSYNILQKGIRALIAALETTVKPKENK